MNKRKENLAIKLNLEVKKLKSANKVFQEDLIFMQSEKDCFQEENKRLTKIISAYEKIFKTSIELIALQQRF